MLAKVSVVVTTLNSESVIEECLQSVRDQDYPQIELLVVDNFSTDRTEAIASKYADHVYSVGPERSAQRNFGIGKATGEFVLIVDADMILERSVVSACVSAWSEERCIVAIPETSFGLGYWAQCKALERSFYVNDETTAAARFFERSVLIDIGGYDQNLHAAEDWDLSIRAERLRPLKFAKATIRHNEGALSLLSLVRKKFYYGASMKPFLQKHGAEARKRLSPMRPSLTGNVWQILKQPHLGSGLIFMKLSEMTAGVFGLLFPQRQTATDIYKSRSTSPK